LPKCPNFCSGPTAKRPGYSYDQLPTSLLGRSHRSVPGKARILQTIQLSRSLLGVPDDFLLAIVPGSDTGAFEMALWNLLGPRPVDVCTWEHFGIGWANDLKLLSGLDFRVFSAPYGELPNVKETDPDHDIVFPYNGTTSGVWVPDCDWISETRQGLTFCDATSAVFMVQLDWNKLDIVTYSWQKALGGEAAHGILVLSPRAVARLESHTPKWPIPKLLLLPRGSELLDLCAGVVINTPSMLVIEDAMDSLIWAESVGGQPALMQRVASNYDVVSRFVEEHSDWIGYLATDPKVRSHTSVCLTLPKASANQVKALCALLDKAGAAYDIASYRTAPAGLRIWCGPTVETSDLELLMPWLSYAYEVVMTTTATS